MATDKTLQGQTYAVDYIRQQVIAAVGWNRAMNEFFASQHDRCRSGKRRLRILFGLISKQSSSGLIITIKLMLPTQPTFKKAKANATMSDQPTPEYLQGAIHRLG